MTHFRGLLCCVLVGHVLSQGMQSSEGGSYALRGRSREVKESLSSNSSGRSLSTSTCSPVERGYRDFGNKHKLYECSDLSDDSHCVVFVNFKQAFGERQSCDYLCNNFDMSCAGQWQSERGRDCSLGDQYESCADKHTYSYCSCEPRSEGADTQDGQGSGDECCDACAGSFCSTRSGRCHDSLAQPWYKDCRSQDQAKNRGQDGGSSCCDACAGSFCSTRSGRCHDSLSQPWYKDCRGQGQDAHHGPAGGECCDACAGSFCSTRSGRCHNSFSQPWYKDCRGPGGPDVHPPVNFCDQCRDQVTQVNSCTVVQRYKCQDSVCVYDRTDKSGQCNGRAITCPDGHRVWCESGRTWECTNQYCQTPTPHPTPSPTPGPSPRRRRTPVPTPRRRTPPPSPCYGCEKKIHCSDGSTSSGHGGTQGCYDNSPMYCSSFSPVPSPPHRSQIRSLRPHLSFLASSQIQSLRPHHSFLALSQIRSLRPHLLFLASSQVPLLSHLLLPHHRHYLLSSLLLKPRHLTMPRASSAEQLPICFLLQKSYFRRRLFDTTYEYIRTMAQ